jgi:anhydro-N-acetylmuramic acid kinase
MMEQLYNIANKKERRIIGLMSGTSMDGLDIALCRFEGSGKQTKVYLERFETIDYDEDFKRSLHALVEPDVNIHQITLWNKKFGQYCGEQINLFLKRIEVKNEEIDLVASHGQTIYHAPLHHHNEQEFGHSTLQIGDGDQIAYITGITTLSDFRQKHIAAGGEGAPLAAYMDYLLFAEEGMDVILLNIGGIANYTYLPGYRHKKMFSTDTGPGNTLMDAWMRECAQQSYDKNGEMASKGKCINAMLNHLMKHPFFQQPVPKSTGREAFHLGILGAASLHIFDKADTMATLNLFTAQTIANNIHENVGYQPMKIYVTGGGCHNQQLMQNLRSLLSHASFHSTKEKNIDPDAKEAILFAQLANECIAGDPKVFEKTGLLPIKMGKISLPL